MSTEKKEKPLNLYQKKNKIMNEVERLAKDAHNDHGGYDYTSEKTIKECFHPLFALYGIDFDLEIIELNILEMKGETKITQAIGVIHLTNVDDPEDHISRKFIGTGNGRNDKGAYAAVTGMIKYYLMSTFLLPTGDDPEGNDNDKDKSTVVKRKSNRTPVEPVKPEQTVVETKKKAPATSVTKNDKEVIRNDKNYYFGIPEGDKIPADSKDKIVTAFSDYGVTEKHLADISHIPIEHWTMNVKEGANTKFNELTSGMPVKKWLDQFNVKM